MKKNKNMRKLLFLSLLALSSITGFAQTENNKFVPGSTLEGINYYMPRTAFRLVVETEKTVTKPGELNKYAFRFLRMADVPTQESTSWRILKVTLEPYGVPDKNKAFNINLSSKSSPLSIFGQKGQTLPPMVSLTKDGILLGIHTEVSETPLPELPKEKPAEKPLEAKKYMSQEMLTASSTAKLAELCAQEIYDIRESRNALVRGEADNTPKDGAQLKLMLDQLATQAEALEQLFKGSVETSTHIFTLDIDPQSEGEEVLFRFSKYMGMVDSDDLSGRPIYLNVKNMDSIPTTVEDPNVTKKKAKMEKGIYYNVPARMAVSIYDEKQTLWEGEYAMGQFGTVEILSDALFNKGVNTKVTFYPQTGGIQKIEQ